MDSIKTEVIIVGAGPTGLSLAVQLMRCGIDFAIFDKKEGVTDLSKATVVHARTLEIYDQIGLAQLAVDQGEIAQQVALLHNGKVRTHLDFTNIGGPLSPFPFVLIFEQSKNERLLFSYLQEAGKVVQWQSELESLTQDATGVRATFKTAKGEVQSVEARYLVGCDGASSMTRHQLGLGFEGLTFPRLFYVADVEMEFEAEEHCVVVSFGKDAFVLFFPLRDEKQWRVVGNLPEYEHLSGTSPDQESKIAFEVIEQKVETLLQRPLNISQVRWFSTYKVHSRHATAFAAGRAFLAGDAAHVHTPAGGQGMNTGIQDAYNLAWKMAMVLKGGAKEHLLESYNEERLANAKRLLQTTDQFFEVAAADQWYSQIFRDQMMPNLASFLWRFDTVKEFIFPFVSQIGIHYRENSLSWHGGDKRFSVKAGDRMPFFRVNGISVYEMLSAPKFHLLAFHDGKSDLSVLGAPIQEGFGAWLDFHQLPFSARVAEIFGAREPFHLLLRPDNHIAFVSAGVNVEGVQNYFRQAIGWV